MRHPVERQNALVVVDPQQYAMVTHTILVQALQIARYVLESKAQRLRMLRKPFYAKMRAAV